MQLKAKIEKICKLCDYVAYAGIGVTMVITVMEFVFRRFGKPMQGTYDLIGLIQVVLVCFAIPYCTLQKGHIRVDMFMRLLPKRVQGVIDSLIGFICLVFFVVVAWQCIELGNNFKRSGDVSMSVFIPLYPFIYCIGMACISVALLLLSDIAESMTSEVKR